MATMQQEPNTTGGVRPVTSAQRPHSERAVISGQELGQRLADASGRQRSTLRSRHSNRLGKIPTSMAKSAHPTARGPRWTPPPSITPTSHPTRTTTAAILASSAPPVRWVIPDYVGEGLTILAGRQQQRQVVARPRLGDRGGARRLGDGVGRLRAG